MIEELKHLVGTNEKIFYEGKPNKKCYIFESIFNPLLPFALLWAIIDFGILGAALFSSDSGMPFFIIPFMLFHLMPVWIYLGGVIFTIRRYKNTAYIITDRAIYVSGGTFTRNYNVKPFAELSHINLHIGMLDQMFNAGYIIATSSQLIAGNTSATIKITSIDNYIDVYNMVKKLQTDIYTDVMYPNAHRPKNNPGYNTKYKG